MASFCLLPEYVDKFKAGLRDGSINPQKLAEMTSEQRNKYLVDFVGVDNAKQVNALFESKLLLKNQKAGMITWAKKVGGLSPQVRRDLISRIEKLDKVLSPKEGEQFLKDLAETRLGVGVTETEAKTIFDLSQKVREARALQKEDLTFATEEQRMAYGRAKVALMNYVNELKENAGRLGIVDTVKDPLKLTSQIAGNAKSIKSSLDISGLLRQGWKTLFTNPIIWQRNARKAFIDAVKTFGGKPVMDEVMADIISRANYDKMVRSKLAIGTGEEAIPGTIATKIPLAGRLFKASEVAYESFNYRMRADIFDKYIDIAEKSNININDVDELKPIASMVNSLTGRGNLGKYEGSAANFLNNVFFSPRFLKSQVDTVGHIFTGAGGSNFVKKQAGINLLKVISGTSAILLLANAVKPGSVEWDFRSSDAGTIRVGNTRFDVTGGLRSIAILATRLAKNSIKNSSTLVVESLDSGEFGKPTKADVVANFITNKFSPASALIRDLLKGETFGGEELTLTEVAKNLFEPLPITTYKELEKDPDAADTLLSMIASSVGIGVNTYGMQKVDWTKSPGKEMQQFIDKVGRDKVKEASDKYNAQYNQWLKQITLDTQYKSKPDDEKEKIISNKKEELKKNIFKQYGFRYQQPKKKKSGSLFK